MRCEVREKDGRIIKFEKKKRNKKKEERPNDGWMKWNAMLRNRRPCLVRST